MLEYISSYYFIANDKYIELVFLLIPSILVSVKLRTWLKNQISRANGIESKFTKWKLLLTYLPILRFMKVAPSCS